MRVALDDLKLERLFVVYPGEKDYALADRIHVLGLRSVERLGDATGGATTLARFDQERRTPFSLSSSLSRDSPRDALR